MCVQNKSENKTILFMVWQLFQIKIYLEHISHLELFFWQLNARNIFTQLHKCRREYSANVLQVCVIVGVVSASDVTPMEHWLNVWCIWHTKVETLQEFRSRRRIGWIIQDFRETCVSRSLTFRMETKMPWRQTPSRKKKAVVFTTVTTTAYQDQINAGFSKVCEIFKVCGIESLKYIREFYTPVCGDISTPLNMTLNETNCDWLFDMLVKWPHGQALANESYHRFQTFSRQSEGLATRDYCGSNKDVVIIQVASCKHYL